MSGTDHEYSGSIPEVYDRHLGPVLFEPYAQDLARRVTGHPPGPVLEIACGTGILTRTLRGKVPANTSIIATDLSESMLSYARAKNGDLGAVEWQRADAASLPFPAASFAAAVCQFGLMFVPDKSAALRECRRVVVDGGVVALNVWDSLDHNPYARTAHETVAKFFPGNPPMFFERFPWGFHDPVALHELFDRNGFVQVSVDRVALEARSISARSLAIGLIYGNPMIKEIEDRGGSHEQILAAVIEALSRLGGERPFQSTMQALVATGRAGRA